MDCLGTTFGGNHLASAAGLFQYLEVIDKEELIEERKRLFPNHFLEKN